MIQKEHLRVLSPTELTCSLDKYISMSKDAKCNEEKHRVRRLRATLGVENILYTMLVSVSCSVVSDSSAPDGL